MKFFKLLLILSLTVFSICARSQFLSKTDGAEQENSIDERMPVNRSAKEFRELNAIGGVSRDGNKIIGTGFLVSPCHVLTNIHVAFMDPLQAKDKSSVYFSVGQTGSFMKPFAEDHIPGEIVAHGKYDGTFRSANEDWVVVRLSKSIGASVGYFPIMQTTPSVVKNLNVLTAGFPATKTDKYGFSSIWADLSCRILGVTGYGYASHTCQTSGGQSGSPILAKGMDGRLYAVGMIQGVHGNHPLRGLDRAEDIENANISVSFYHGSLPSSSESTSSGERIKKTIETFSCNP